jgi:hypothetical protein
MRMGNARVDNETVKIEEKNCFGEAEIVWIDVEGNQMGLAPMSEDWIGREVVDE